MRKKDGESGKKKKPSSSSLVKPPEASSAAPSAAEESSSKAATRGGVQRSLREDEQDEYLIVKNDKINLLYNDSFRAHLKYNKRCQKNLQLKKK